MQEVIVYRVPPSPIHAEMVPDVTSVYRETITSGLAPSGHVHTGRFWRLAHFGDTNVFIGVRAPIVRVRASVALLWDYSSSQAGFEPALRFSLATIGAALSRLDIDVWAGAYTTQNTGTGIFEVSGWHDRWDHKRVSTLSNIHMGGTPTGVAMHYVRRRVLPRAPHARRLLLVCTDGQPGDPLLVRQEVRAIRATGCLVVGLYVGSDDASDFEQQYDQRYSFAAPTREEIPVVLNKILGRLAGELRR